MVADIKSVEDQQVFMIGKLSQRTTVLLCINIAQRQVLVDHSVCSLLIYVKSTRNTADIFSLEQKCPHCSLS